MEMPTSHYFTYEQLASSWPGVSLICAFHAGTLYRDLTRWDCTAWPVYVHHSNLSQSAFSSVQFNAGIPKEEVNAVQCHCCQVLGGQIIYLSSGSGHGTLQCKETSALLGLRSG
jgi:hypothetical protein